MFNRRKNPIKYLGNELTYLKNVINSENWSATSGSWNNLLENEFAKLHNTHFAVAMNSGTATLHSALLALGVKPGDEVITPGLSVIMDSTCIFHANAIPIYVDVNPKTFNIEPSKIEEKITKKTKAIIVVSLYGLPADFDEIKKISNTYNIPIIEDNAQCMLSTYKKKPMGSFGDISSWSFETTKHLSCGEGGIVTTNREELAIKLRKIGGHGYKNLSAKEGRIRLNQEVFQNPDYKRHDSLGWNYRLSEFSAAIAFAQLENVQELVDLRIKSAEILIDAMIDFNFMKPQYTPNDRINSYYTLGVNYLGQEEKGVSWDYFRKKYISNGGDGFYGAWSVPYLEPLIQQNIFQSHNLEIYANVNYQKDLCPVAEEVQKNLMQFKTNYRDIKLAKKKAKILNKTLKEISR